MNKQLYSVLGLFQFCKETVGSHNSHYEKNKINNTYSMTCSAFSKFRTIQLSDIHYTSIRYC
nr:hypothetical protein [Ruminococcus bromii]